VSSGRKALRLLLTAGFVAYLFGVGMAFIVDTGVWQQPVGILMVTASVTIIVMLILWMPAAVRAAVAVELERQFSMSAADEVPR
jgi:hypothetical protein